MRMTRRPASRGKTARKFNSGANKRHITNHSVMRGGFRL